MRLIDADKIKIGISEKTRTDSDASRFIDIINAQPTAFDLERVIEQINNIKTDNSCSDCKYKDKCDELQEFYNPADDVDLCALTTKYLSLAILKSAVNDKNSKKGD